MEHLEVYNFERLEEDNDKTSAYRNLLKDLRKTERILEAMIALSKAYPVTDY